VSEPTEEGGFVFRDNRKIDPETGRARPAPPSGGQGGPAGPADPDAPGDGLSEADAFAAALAAEEAAAAGLADRTAELTADLQRVHAEYANYRKRVERDREVVRDTAVAGALGTLLPVLDDIARARARRLEASRASRRPSRPPAARLEVFGTVGEQFDPEVHEASRTPPPRSTARSSRARPSTGPATATPVRVVRPAQVGVADVDAASVVLPETTTTDED
jgi:molecular chaperone GrpE